MDDEQKKKGIIATIVATLLCGCPGLFSLCFGAALAATSFVPDAQIDIFGSNDPNAAFAMGIGVLCLGLIFIAIPVGVGFKMLRQKKEG
ncbi:MAG: hypothetical protein Fur0018_17740 [Anaerolineales bacterium]